MLDCRTARPTPCRDDRAGRTMMPSTTTLTAIRAQGPAPARWRRLLASLGKRAPDDEPLLFRDIIASNGLYDALWCLKALPEGYHGSIIHLACDYAERVLPMFEDYSPHDKRPRRAIEVARRFADGEATREELDAACEAAYRAASEVNGRMRRQRSRRGFCEAGGNSEGYAACAARNAAGTKYRGVGGEATVAAGYVLLAVLRSVPRPEQCAAMDAERQAQIEMFVGRLEGSS